MHMMEQLQKKQRLCAPAGPIYPEWPAGKGFQGQGECQQARYKGCLEAHRKGQRQHKLQQQPIIILPDSHDTPLSDCSDHDHCMGQGDIGPLYVAVMLTWLQMS